MRLHGDHCRSPSNRLGTLDAERPVNPELTGCTSALLGSHDHPDGPAYLSGEDLLFGIMWPTRMESAPYSYLCGWQTVESAGKPDLWKEPPSRLV